MSFYSQGFKDIFTGAINAVNSLPFPLTEGMFNVINPRAILSAPDGGIDAGSANTVATLVATGLKNEFGESYGRQIDVYYSRLDLSLLFKGVDVVWVTTATSTAAFADWLAGEYDIPMSPSDIEDVEIPVSSDKSYIEIMAAGDSPWFTGSIHVYYTKGAASLSSLSDPSWLTGVSSPQPSVDTNYVQSYSHDYTGTGALLRQGVTANTETLRQNLWSALFGTRENQWVSGITGVLYTGEANVRAAGGRAGFNNLLIVPRLNAWAHFND